MLSSYPSPEDYIRAVQTPSATSRLPILRGAVFESHPTFGIPMPVSGNAAVVFKARVDGMDRALRFFVREVVAGRRRYAALDRHCEEHVLSDVVAPASWVDDVIEVNGQAWPMVQMDWIDGRTLDSYVEGLALRRNVEALHLLAGGWRDRVRRLQAADFAHGDLQHGNVIVDASRALRFVDLDASWVPELDGVPPPAEAGHENYQVRTRQWGRWMDTFPALVIYTGLLVLSRRPELWDDLSTGENLVFTRQDFEFPFTTHVWQTLADVDDPEFRHVVGRLQRCCVPRWSAQGSLEDVLRRDRIAASTPTAGRRADDRQVRWWEKAAGGTASTSTSTSGSG